MIIGIGRSFMDSFLQFDQRWSFASQGLAPVVLFFAVLLLPRAPLDTGRLKLTQRKERLTTPREALLGAFVILGLAVAWANGWIVWFTGTNFGQRSDVWLNVGILSLIFGVIMLSLVPLTGWAGQVSFANFAIAGFGAVMFSKLGGPDGNALGAGVRGGDVRHPRRAHRPSGPPAAGPLPRPADDGLRRGRRQAAVPAPARHQPGVDRPHLRRHAPVRPDDRSERQEGVPDLRRGGVRGDVPRARRCCGEATSPAVGSPSRDSPAASATIGVNITDHEGVAWAVSGAIAGFAGALLGLYRGSLTVDSFPLFAGLPIVLLLAAQGVRFPIAAFMGALALMSFPALQTGLRQPAVVERAAGHRPRHRRDRDGLPAAGRGLLQRERPRTDTPMAQGRAGGEGVGREAHAQQDIRRDEIGELGLERPFTDEKVAQLDRILSVADELADRPETGAGHVAVVEEEVDNVAPVG